LNSLPSLWTDYSTFLSDNIPPQQNKILVSVLVVFTFSTIIFSISAILNTLRAINLLKIEEYTLRRAAIWVAGAVLLDFILVSTRIIAYNVVGFLLISMIWDVIYQRLFNQAREHIPVLALEPLEQKNQDS